MDKLKYELGLIVGVTATVFIGFTIADKINKRTKKKLLKAEKK